MVTIPSTLPLAGGSNDVEGSSTYIEALKRLKPLPDPVANIRLRAVIHVDLGHLFVSLRFRRLGQPQFFSFAQGEG